MAKRDDDKLVYSTDRGRMCPDCGRAADACSCSGEKPAPAGDGIVRLQRETKGRKGKGVTLITGLVLNGAELKSLAKHLKKRCGSGGTIKGHLIEIQGDVRDVLKAELEKLGHTVKITGG